MQHLTPSIRLYLSGNMLEDVPGEVYRLKNLQVLSLRTNNITEIIPSITELKRLDEINLACNRLRWLPWEFRSFLERKPSMKCILHPNPFIKPLPPIHASEYQQPFDLGHCRHLASTHIAFFDVRGLPESRYPPPPSLIAEHYPEPSGDEEALRPPLSERSRVPSLMEFALRACFENPQLSQMPFLLPDDCPPHIISLLKLTWRLKEAGSGRKCSVCGKSYIIPRTEWMEWRYCIPDRELRGEVRGDRDGTGHCSGEDVSLPLLRRGCSWNCFVEGPPHGLIRGWRAEGLEDLPEKRVEFWKLGRVAWEVGGVLRAWKSTRLRDRHCGRDAHGMLKRF